MENWESEFLQMFLFIALTAFLYQRGSAESKKLETLFKDANQFWTGRNNKEAADWAMAAMNHAAAITKAAAAKNTEGIAASQKELGGMCQSCHAKYREKTETGFAIKKS